MALMLFTTYDYGNMSRLDFMPKSNVLLVSNSYIISYVARGCMYPKSLKYILLSPLVIDRFDAKDGT